MALRPDLKKYLEYIRNTGGNATINDFDDDHDPIGSLVRADIEGYFVVNSDGKLELTELGKAEIA